MVMAGMMAGLAMWALLDGVASDVMGSANVVPVAGTVMILGIAVAGIWSGVRRREMESQERLAAIAKGLAPVVAEVPTPQTMDTLSRQRENSRKAGLVLASVGVGLALFGLVLAWVVRERDVLVVAGTGLIPLAIGVGFLLDAQMKGRELLRAGESRSRTLVGQEHLGGGAASSTLESYEQPQ